MAKARAHNVLRIEGHDGAPDSDRTGSSHRAGGEFPRTKAGRSAALAAARAWMVAHPPREPAWRAPAGFLTIHEVTGNNQWKEWHWDAEKTDGVWAWKQTTSPVTLPPKAPKRPAATGPVPAGMVRISARDGVPLDVPASGVKGGLVVANPCADDQDGVPCWSVTHVASGSSASGRVKFHTESAAIAMRTELLALPIDWTLSGDALMASMSTEVKQQVVAVHARYQHYDPAQQPKRAFSGFGWAR